MNKKYELTDETKTAEGKTLHRIRALRDFTLLNGDIVHCGDLGGFVESEENLSHEGNAWVGGNALVFGNAMVFGNARVSGHATVSGNAMVFGNARVYGDARVYGAAGVFNNGEVCGDAWVCDHAIVCDDARVYDAAQVYGYARVHGYARVCHTAQVYGNADVFGAAKISRRAEISRTDHYFVCGPCGDEAKFVTFYWTASGIWVSYGRFCGSIDDFLDKVEETHGDNKHAQVHRQLAEVARTQIEEEDSHGTTD